MIRRNMGTGRVLQEGEDRDRAAVSWTLNLGFDTPDYLIWKVRKSQPFTFSQYTPPHLSVAQMLSQGKNHGVGIWVSCFEGIAG